jgi:hypothetical protein
MTQSLVGRDRAEAKKKGWLAVAAWAGTGFLAFNSSFLLMIPAAIGAGYLTLRWFRFRAQRGMRF